MQTNKTVKRKLLKKLGINIKYYRTKLNLSQEELAFDVNIERSYITAIEAGTKSPSLYCLYTLANRLEVPLKDLLDIQL
ncbi:helix-turn-helix transcriptional regulator [bacterium]|nr:helix-turn-helix transcriptional regulator [bacterium]